MLFIITAQQVVVKLLFPPWSNLVWPRLFLQGEKLLIAYTLAVTLKKCCGIESNQITCV